MQLDCGRSLEKFPNIVKRLKQILERFANALSYVNRCFIAGDLLDTLPKPSQVSTTQVGGIDINKPRMRAVAGAVVTLSVFPQGFMASDLADRVCTLTGQARFQYTARQAAYDLKKLRGKTVIRQIGHKRRYETIPQGLRALTVVRHQFLRR